MLLFDGSTWKVAAMAAASCSESAELADQLRAVPALARVTALRLVGSLLRRVQVPGGGGRRRVVRLRDVAAVALAEHPNRCVLVRRSLLERQAERERVLLVLRLLADQLEPEPLWPWVAVCPSGSGSRRLPSTTPCWSVTSPSSPLLDPNRCVAVRWLLLHRPGSATAFWSLSATGRSAARRARTCTSHRSATGRQSALSRSGSRR